MARKIEYQIGFIADTNQLQTALKQAATALQQVGKDASNQLTAQLRSASQAALDLETHLSNAYNVDTGKLDLTAFQRNLQASGLTLEEYGRKLSLLGPQGEQAFLKVAQAISAAELPIRRSSAALDKLWITMKNTLRWQLTSGMLHGFIGAVQTAYGYTQDLNESLNSIRIVTQKSVEDMDKFAVKANEAAEKLSTTTTRYTDAALIYYQQGLTDEEVEGRTEVTIKLANAAGEAAETASQQLTAVWNNFYDGTKSLEYYADVMTALGATTASSTSEISQGLQKFAAVADTVGLSYEYAAAALATVTATTRESADIVGTAFRTLFGRLESLKLGETLDDETTLKQYSEALLKVGVNIKDVNGDLKDMDDILEETGAKWQMLSRDQQMALAQTVAGVRQYAQFIALMDNWDFFQENLQTAYGSEGTLQEQADVFAESWESARNRVRAAAEDVYNSIFDEKLFIDVANGATVLLHRIDNIIDTVGGLGGALNTVFNIATQLYGARMAQGIRDQVYNLQQSLGINQEIAIALKEQATAAISNVNVSDQTEIANLLDMQNQAYTRNNEAQIALNRAAQQLTEEQQKQLSQQAAQVDEARELVDQYTQAAKQLLIARQEAEQWVRAEGSAEAGIYDAAAMARRFSGKDNQETRNILKDTLGYSGRINYQDIGTEENLRKLQDAFISTQKAMTNYRAEQKRLNAIQEEDRTPEQTARIEELKAVVGEAAQRLNIYRTALQEGFRVDPEALKNFVAVEDELIEKTGNASDALLKQSEALEALNNKIQTTLGSSRDFAASFVTIAQTLSSIAIAINAIQSLGRIFTDEDMSFADRMTTALMSIGMLMQSVMTVSKSLQASYTGQAIAQKVVLALTAAEGQEVKTTGLAKLALVVANKTLAKSEVEVAGAAEMANAALAGTAVAAGAVIAVIALVAGAVAFAAHQVTEAKKRQDEYNQSLVDTGKATKEAIDSNRDLVRSFNDALSVYQETGDNKEELDEITHSLADAYDLEGSALAKLTGRYEDYNEIAKQALEKRRSELRDALEDEQAGLEGAAYNITKAATEGRGFVNSGIFTFAFNGWGNEGDLLSVVKDTVAEISGLQGYDMFDSAPGFQNLEYNFADTAENYIKLYDGLIEAQKRLNHEFSGSDLTHSGIYQDIDAWLEKMRDVIEEYRTFEASIAEIKVQLGEFRTQSLLDTDIKSFADYTQWIKEVTSALSQLEGWDDTRITEFIDTLASTSVNEQVRQFRDYAKAIDDISKINPNISKDWLEGVWTDSAKGYNTDILALVSWRTITEDSFDEAYAAAQKYRDALNQTSDATNALAAAQQALKDLGTGELSLESMTALQSGIDWSAQAQDFATFLNSTYSEQQTFLNQLISDSYNELLTGNQEVIESRQEELERLKAEYAETISAMDLEAAESEVRAWETVKEEYQSYQQALKDGNETAQLEAFNKLYSVLSDISPDIDIDLSGTEEEVLSAIDEASKAARVYIDKEEQFEVDINEAQKALDDAVSKQPLYVKAQFDFQIDRIKNSTDNYVAVFDAIAKGVSHSTDEMGNSFWSFSIEASEAIDAIYPGFLANAEVVRDGTFKLNDEMYQSFFNMLNAEVAADGNGIAAMLENRIGYLESRRNEAQSALEIAEKLANGELTLEELKNKDMAEARDLLMKHYEEAQQIANGDMLKAEADYLEDSQGNYETLWDNVSDYSAQCAENMADNVATGTESVLDNLKAIRDQAYDAMHAVASIGTEGATEAPRVDRTAKWSGNGTGLMKSGIVDTSGEDAFIKSLKEYQYSDMPSTVAESDIDNQISRAAGRALREIYQQEVNAYNEAIGAAKIAQAKLFKSIDDAYNAADKAGKTGSKNREQQLKDLEEIFERYHEITREIEYQEQVLKKLSTQIDRTYGTKRLDLYKQKLEELNKLADLQDQKAKAAAAFITIDAANLEDLGLVGKFNDHYELTNYTDLLEGALKDYNAAVESYNARINAEGADKDALEAELKVAEQLYKDRQEALEHYEDSVDTYRELVEAWEDTQRTIEDEKLNEITYKMDLVLDLKQLKQDVRDFMKDIAESYGDALTHTLDNARQRGVAGLMADNAQAEIDMFDHYVTEYNELKSRMAEATEFTDTDAIREAMEDLTHNIIDSGEALLEWIDYWENMVPEAVEAARERFNQFTDQLEHNVTVLDTIKELYALRGQTYKTQQGFDRLQRVSQERMEAQLASSVLNRKWYERAAADLQNAQNELDRYLANGGTEQGVEYDYLKNARDAFLTEFNEAQEAYLKSAQEAMETARDMYVQQIERAAYEFAQAATPAGDLDFWGEQYDHFIEGEEHYLDAVNRAYQENTWNSKIQLDYDNDILKTHHDLIKAFEDEKNALFARNKINEYDLEVLETRYKVLQAQMALEDAENAKNNLQLVRDRQGNWNYRYTSNPDDIAAAQQDLADAQNDWYNIAKQQTKDVTGEIVATWKEAQDAIREIWEDDEFNEAEKSERSLELQRYYSEKMQDLYNDRAQAMADMTEAGMNNLTNYENKYELTLAGMTSDNKDFQKALNEYLDLCRDDFREYESTIDDIATETHTDLDSMKKDIDAVSTATDTLKKSGEECATVLWNSIDKVYQAGESYRIFAEKVEAAISKLRELAVMQANDIQGYSGTSASPTPTSSGGTLADYSAGMMYAAAKYGYGSAEYNRIANARDVKWNDNARITDEQREAWKTTEQWNQELKDSSTTVEEFGEKFGQGAIDAIEKWLKNPSSYDTGGYTGSWGASDGKLAILHEKELVLNQTDTANILAAVDGVRAIEQALDRNAAIALGSLVMRLGGYVAPAATEQSSNTTNHFDVYFPNVTDHNEIELALRNLELDADQYVNRRTD